MPRIRQDLLQPEKQRFVTDTFPVHMVLLFRRAELKLVVLFVSVFLHLLQINSRFDRMLSQGAHVRSYRLHLFRIVIRGDGRLPRPRIPFLRFDRTARSRSSSLFGNFLEQHLHYVALIHANC